MSTDGEFIERRQDPLPAARPFAKLFGPDTDQVVVLLGTAENLGAEIRVFVQPKGLGVCSVAYGYADTKEGWAKAETVFAGIDEAWARDLAKPLLTAVEEKGGQPAA